MILAQNRIDRQHLSNPESFTFVVFGDVQSYTKNSVYQPIYELCTAWVADNVENLNIKAVLFTGDLIQRNENIVPGRGSVNQTSRQMWEWSSHCLERLDGKVPYIIAAGNHEYGYTRGDEAFTHYPEYYTYERNPLTANHSSSNVYMPGVKSKCLPAFSWRFISFAVAPGFTMKNFFLTSISSPLPIDFRV